MTPQAVKAALGATLLLAVAELALVHGLAVAEAPAVRVVAVADAPVVRVGDRTWTMAEVDAATEGRAELLRARLVRTAINAAWALVDERLELDAPKGSPSRSRVEEPKGSPSRSRVEERKGSPSRSRVEERRAAGARLALPPVARLEEALAPDEVVAWVGDEAIPGAALEQRAAVALYRLRGELFRERKRRAEEIVEEALLAGEAAKQGIEVSDLLAARPVTDDVVDGYVSRRRREGVNVRAEEIRPLLEYRASEAKRQQLLDRLRAEVDVEIRLRPPAPPTIDALDASAPALGPPAPPERTVVLFADYRSQPSRRMHREVDRLRTLAPDVRVVLRDSIPVPDPVAEEAARLARCADRSGRVELLRAELLARKPPRPGSPWYDGEDLRGLAARLATDEASLVRCLNDPATIEAVGRDSETARRLGLVEAPAVVAAGHPLSGLQSAETLLAALGGAPPSAAD